MSQTRLPNNQVSFQIEHILNNFISSLTQTQSLNLKSVFLTGSYARGDATDASDIDLWCIFHQVDLNVLDDVGWCVQNIIEQQPSLEINPQCFSVKEFESVYFADWTEKVVKVLDSVLLYGDDLIGNNVSTADIELIYKKYLANVLLSIRHYLSVDEPVQKLTCQKIQRYILKPLMFPLRLERWCTCGSYPLSITDLKNAYSDPVSEIIHFYMHPEVLERDLLRNHRDVLYKMHTIVSHLLFPDSPQAVVGQIS
jgi:hypothetical protein